MRTLTQVEITTLEAAGCSSADWSTVRVAEGFMPAWIVRSRLLDVELGRDVRLADCRVAHAVIGDGARLDRVDELTRTHSRPFAHDARADVLTEDGARSVPLWRGLTAQTAHILSHLRFTPAATELERIIARDARSLRLPHCVVGAGARLTRCGLLADVWIGPGAQLEGVRRLRNCYVASLSNAPARIGELVDASDSIFLAGCEVTDGVRMEACLAGEGSRLHTGLDARHSLFWANSDFALGEADCIMAGPFAVSGHKSTLALTCQCSFCTFGSGSNASNHHFKLGPNHGGVLRRGVKLGSGSYLYWPSDIGAFTTVIGRHKRHIDTHAFPFSLLMEENGRSVLIPAVNIFTSGLARDAAKWIRRDRRSGIQYPGDLVNARVYTPYVFDAVDQGLRLLQDTDGDVEHHGVIIPGSRVAAARVLYRAARVLYVGSVILDAARQASHRPDAVSQIVRESVAPPAGRWRDWAGCIIPGEDAESILERLANGTLADAETVQAALRKTHDRYAEYELAWAAAQWQELWGLPNPDGLTRFKDDYTAVQAQQRRRESDDADKEYTPQMQYGFGLEEPGDAENPEAAFVRIRTYSQRIPTPPVK